MAWVSWVLLLAGGWGVAQAQDRPGRPAYTLQVPPMGSEASELVWPSGLRMAIAHDTTRPVVVTTLVVGGGTRDDAAGRAGTGQLAEAAWWSTRTPTGPTVLEALTAGAGCVVDSVADHDALTFQSVCPAETADAAMRVWSLLFTAPFAGLDDAALDRVAERAARDATVRQRLSERPILSLTPWLHMQLFPPDHPYWGEPAPDLKRLAVSDLRAWASKHLVPANVSLSLVGGWPAGNPAYGTSLVAGNFAPELLHPRLRPDLIQRKPKEGFAGPDPADLSRWWAVAMDPAVPTQLLGWAREPDPLSAAFSAGPPDPPGAPHARFPGPVDEPTVLVGWSLPPSWHETDALYDVASRVLHAVIAKNLVGQEPALARFSGCQMVPGLVATTLACVAVLHEGQEASGERVARRIVDQLSNLVDPEQRAEVAVAVNRGQMLMVGDALRSHTRMAGLHGTKAAWVAQGVHFASDTMAGVQRVARAAAVTPEAVVDLGTTLLTRARAVSVQLDPLATEEITLRRLPDADDVDAARTQGTYWTRIAAGAVPVAVPPAVLDAARVAAAGQPPEVRVRTLRNGLPLAIITHGQAPMAVVRLATLGGTANDPTPHKEHFLGRDLVRPHLEDAVPVGGAWAAWRGELLHEVSLAASVRNLEAGMWMLREVLESATPSVRDKAAVVAARQARIAEQWHDVAWHVDDLGLAHALGPAHPLGREPSWADVAAWSSVGADAARDMWRSKWRPEGSVLVAVVGKGAEEDAFVFADTFLGGWRPPEPVARTWMPGAVPPASPRGGREVVLLPEGRELAEVRLLCPLPGDRALGPVLEPLVRAALDGRWASSDVGVTVIPGVGLLDVAGRAAPGEVGGAVAGLLAALEEAAGGRLTDQTVRAAAWLAALAAASETRDPHVMAGRVAEALAWGEDLRQPHDLAARIAQVSPAAVASALRSCTASVWVGVVGDEVSAGASLRAAGLTPRVEDWRARGDRLHQEADPAGFARYRKTVGKPGGPTGGPGPGGRP